MATYPTDGDIDTTFPDNATGDIGADDMRAFQKLMTAAGIDYAAMTENVPATFPPAAHTHLAADIPAGIIYPHDAAAAYTKDDIVSHEGGVYFAVDTHAPEAFNFTNFKTVGPGTGSGVTIRYEWTATTSGQVPTGQYGVTGPVGDANNTVRVSNTSETGIDASPFWINIVAGDYLLFIEDSGGAESILHQATGPAVFQAGSPGYYEIPVTLLDVVGESEDNRRGLVSIVTNPSSKVPAGGDTNQVLRKNSSADYNMDWADSVTLGGDPAALDLALGTIILAVETVPSNRNTDVVPQLLDASTTDYTLNGGQAATLVGTWTTRGNLGTHTLVQRTA